MHNFITDAEIRALRDEAAIAYDLAQVALCDIALTGRAIGWAAITLARDCELTLSKFADPTEGVRTGLTVDEASDIARVDAALIYLDGEDREAARDACADAILRGMP